MRGTQQGTSSAPAWAVGPGVAPVGWALVVGGACGALLWLPALIGPFLLDVHGVVEAAELGRRAGAQAALLPLPAAGSVLVGLTLLRGGWAAVQRRLLWVVYGATAVGALAGGLHVGAVIAAGLLAALLVLRSTSLRRPHRFT